MTFARFPAGLRAEPRPSCRILAEPSQLPLLPEVAARARRCRQRPRHSCGRYQPGQRDNGVDRKSDMSEARKRRSPQVDLSGCWKFERRRFFEGVLQGVCRGRQFCIFSQAAKLLQFRPRRPNLGDMLVAQPKTSILSQRARDLSALHNLCEKGKQWSITFQTRALFFEQAEKRRPS